MCVTFVEKVLRWNSASKNIYKKSTKFVWLLVKDMKIPYIFYKIQNFLGTPWASIIATCLIKLLRTGPFCKNRLKFWHRKLESEESHFFLCKYFLMLHFILKPQTLHKQLIKCLFCRCISDSYFFLEYFLHSCHDIALNIISMWKIM